MMKRNLTTLLGAGLIIFGILTPVSTIPIVFILPPEYRSQARLLIPPSPKVVLEGEAELLQSRLMLSPVITNLGLTKRFAEELKVEQDLPIEVALALLRRQVEVKANPKTRILEIGVYSSSRSQAADIANELTKVYLASGAAEGRDSQSTAKLIESASPAFRPSRPNPPLAIARSVGFGLLLILAGAWIIYCNFKQRSRSLAASPPPLPET